MANIVLEDKTFALANTLMVAYKLQEKNNHKSYLDVLRDIPNQGIEKQIQFIYTAFEVANPEAAQEWPLSKFQTHCLESMTLADFQKLLVQQIRSLSGQPEDVDVDEEELRQKVENQGE